MDRWIRLCAVFILLIEGGCAAASSTTRPVTLTTGDGPHQVPAPQPCDTPSPPPEPASELWRFQQGTLGKVEGPLEQISNADENATFDHLRCLAGVLQNNYDLRAGRQQTFLDVGSNAVFAGASIHFLAAGAGAATQGLWTAASAAPVVLGEFHAYEPTRDLYQAAGLALAALTSRYGSLDRDITLLAKDFPQPDPKKPDEVKQGLLEEGSHCQAVETSLPKVAEWPDSDRLVFLPVVQEMKSACLTSLTNRRQLADFAGSVVGWRPQLITGFRDDTLILAREVAAQDRGLRYTPIQTVSAIAATPFQAVGSMLSGENGKAAAEALKSQKTIQSLRFQASPLLLSEPPGAMPAPPELPASLQDRARSARKAGQKPTYQEVNDVASSLEQARSDLIVDKVRYDRDFQAVQRITALAPGGDIETEFDPLTRGVTVRLTQTTSQPISLSGAH